MSRKRARRAEPVTPELVLRDFELYSDESGVTATVSGAELRDLIGRLARANGFEEGELLGNVSIPAGKPLPCRLIQRLPAGCSWIPDGSGYILAKLARNKTVAGHSFLGDGSSERRDPSYRGGASAAQLALNDEPSSPPRRPTRRARTPGWMAGHSASPQTPDSGERGRYQPVPVRLHRAAALATSATPEAHFGHVVRHVCGHKQCGVVAHFRFGTLGDNEDDEEHHRTHPGCSRECLPCLQ